MIDSMRDHYFALLPASEHDDPIQCEGPKGVYRRHLPRFHFLRDMKLEYVAYQEAL